MEIIPNTIALLTEPWALLAMFAALLFAIESYLDEWLLKLFKVEDNPTTDTREDGSAVGQYIIVSGLFGFATAFAIWSVFFWLGDTQTLSLSNTLLLQAVGIGFMELLWVIPYMYAVERSGALATAPLMQLIPIFTVILGFTIFQDVPPTPTIIGIVVIVAGAALLDFSTETKRLRLDVLLLMSFATLTIASIYFIFKDVAVEGNFWAAGFWVSIGMGLCATSIWLVWPPYRRQFNEFARSLHYKALAVNALNESSATASVFTANAAVLLAPSVSLAAALNAYQPIFVLVIGWLLSLAGSEPHRRQLSDWERIKKPVAILFIAIGTILVASG